MSHINKEKKRIAMVTGATGFVGSHLVGRLVRDGWAVHILIRTNSVLPDRAEFSQVTQHQYDGSIKSMVKCVTDANPVVVFHLASLFLAQHETDDVEGLIKSNVLLGCQLLEAMQQNHVPYIIDTGTTWQHYQSEDYNPVGLYAATKQAFDAILEYYVQACSIKAITLKLSDTYGPNDRRPKILGLLEKTARTHESLPMSPGEQLIDLVHIDDVVNAYLVAVQRLMDGKVALHERYGVLSHAPLTLRSLVALYEQAVGFVLPIRFGDRPYRKREVMRPWPGTVLPGWKSTITLQDYIEQFTRKK